MRYIIIFAIGICAGYNYGFHDAQKNDKPIVTRIVEQVGGATRDHMKNDIDSKMDNLERR
jgi:hypothetical protein